MVEIWTDILKVCPKTRWRSILSLKPVLSRWRSLEVLERREMVGREDERQNLYKKCKIIRDREEFRGDKGTRQEAL